MEGRFSIALSLDISGDRKSPLHYTNRNYIKHFSTTYLPWRKSSCIANCGGGDSVDDHEAAKQKLPFIPWFRVNAKMRLLKRVFFRQWNGRAISKSPFLLWAIWKSPFHCLPTVIPLKLYFNNSTVFSHWPKVYFGNMDSKYNVYAELATWGCMHDFVLHVI